MNGYPDLFHAFNLFIWTNSSNLFLHTTEFTKFVCNIFVWTILKNAGTLHPIGKYSSFWLSLPSRVQLLRIYPNPYCLFSESWKKTFQDGFTILYTLYWFSRFTKFFWWLLVLYSDNLTFFGRLKRKCSEVWNWDLLLIFLMVWKSHTKNKK